MSPLPVKYSIYIPSRGRADVLTTSKLLANAGIQYNLVVEPQEYDWYCEYHPQDQVIKMDKGGMGI